MEVNTCVISLERLKELELKEESIRDRKWVTFFSGTYSMQMQHVTPNEAIDKVIKANKATKSKFNDIDADRNKIYNELNKIKEHWAYRWIMRWFL